MTDTMQTKQGERDYLLRRAATLERVAREAAASVNSDGSQNVCFAPYLLRRAKALRERAALKESFNG